MVAANASARGQRHAILRSPRAELTSVRRGAVVCPDGAGGLLRATHDRWRCIAPNALRTGLWRASAGGLAGDRPDTQRARQPSEGGAAGAGGEGVTNEKAAQEGEVPRAAGVGRVWFSRPKNSAAD